jgi:apolipoprotein N-acyltransferase
VRALPLGVDGVIDAPLPRAIEMPPYARFGDVPFFLLLAALALAAFLSRRRQSRKAGADFERW